MTTKNQRVRLWQKFEDEWWPCLRKFEAGNVGAALEPDAIQAEKLANAIGSWTNADRKYLEATHLPDVWIGIHPDCKLLSGQSGERTDVHRSVIEGTTMVLTDLQNLKRPKEKKKTETPMERFEDDLAQERIRMVQISAAEFNPRYQGRVEKGRSAATKLLARTAVGLVRSRQISEPQRLSDTSS